MTKPTPPLPLDSETDLLDNGGSEDHGEGDNEDEYAASPTARVAPVTTADPYANLDSVFGGYSTDQPKPQHTDDLLF